MKKIGIMIFALLLAGWGRVNAQQRNAQMHTYFQQTILPFVEQQQAKFEQVLTPAEKKELAEIRQEMVNFRKQGAQMRKAMQGNYNQAAWNARKAQFEAIIAKVRKIVEAHPKAAAAYKNAVEKKIMQWQQQMPAMAGGRMGMQGRGQGMAGKSPRSKLQRLSDPAFGLLMDARAMNGMMMHHPNRMNGTYRMKQRTGKPGRWSGMPFPGHFSDGMMMAVRNPKVQAQIKSYVEKNILPVVKKERAAFDKYLSKKEKKIIADARADMQAQKEKLQQMRSAGNRPSDSARLAMQVKMQENRLVVQQIMLKHYAELQKVMAPIREKMPQWRTDIRKIVAQYIVEQQMKQHAQRPGAARKFLKERGDIMFLLMDPNNPGNNSFFQIFGGKKIKK